MSTWEERMAARTRARAEAASTAEVDGWFCRCGVSEKTRMRTSVALARLEAHQRDFHPAPPATGATP